MSNVSAIKKAKQEWGMNGFSNNPYRKAVYDRCMSDTPSGISLNVEQGEYATLNEAKAHALEDYLLSFKGYYVDGASVHFGFSSLNAHDTIVSKWFNYLVLMGMQEVGRLKAIYKASKDGRDPTANELVEIALECLNEFVVGEPIKGLTEYSTLKTLTLEGKGEPFPLLLLPPYLEELHIKGDFDDISGTGIQMLIHPAILGYGKITDGRICSRVDKLITANGTFGEQ